MAKKVQKTIKPHYDKIYREIIKLNNTTDGKAWERVLSKKNKTVYEIVELDNVISGVYSKEEYSFNQKHRAYDEDTIKYILEYQSEHTLTNTETSQIFKVSRNTIAKWRKLFK